MTTTPLDITIVSKEEFLKAKENIDTTTGQYEKLQKLYSSLFQEYECFTKVEPSFTPSSTFSHSHQSNQTNKFNGKNNRQSHYKGQYNNHSYGSQKTHITRHHSTKPITKVFDGSLTNDPDGDVKRKLKGLLNIINKNNYKKVSHKVKGLLTKDNARTVYEVILATTCNQVFYINVFITLIVELNAYLPVTTEVCVAVVNEFIENFIYKKEYLMLAERYVTGSNEYEMFCFQQKHKSMITSKNLVIVEFLKKHFSKKWSVQTYADGLIDTLDDIHTNGIGIGSDNDLEVNTDIILTLLKDLKAVDKSIKIDTTVVSKILENKMNQRITFMAQDIINLEWS